MTRQTERGEDASGERESIESRRESRFCPKAIPDVVKKERKPSSCSSSSTRRVLRRARTRTDADDATVVRDANGSGNPRRASSNDASLPPSASASAAASSAVAPAAPTSAAEPLPAPAPASVSAPAPASPPARRPLLLLLEVLLLDEADHLIRDADVLDGVPAHVAVGHAPEPVAVLARADHLLQVHVHPRVAAHKVAVVRLAVLKLHQLRERDARGTNEAKKMDDERRGVSARERRKKASRQIFVDAGRSIRARSPASRAARAPCRDTAEARDARAGPRETKRRLDVPWGGPGTSSAARGAASRAVVVLDCGTRPITRAAGESVCDRWGLTARRAGAPFAIERLGSSRTIEDAGSVSPSRRARWRVATPRGRARLPHQSRISGRAKKHRRVQFRARSVSHSAARQQRQSGSRGVRPRLGA